MSFGTRLTVWVRNPSVLMVVLGLALYPFVRDDKPARVLRLTPAQAERALARERTRSDAAETPESQARAYDEALDEEALAELAIAEELHRNDDGLRLALAQAARRELTKRAAAPTPTDAELHALAAGLALEALVDAEVRVGSGDTERIAATKLADLEARLGIRHLPMPTDAPVTTTVTSARGETVTLTLTVHPESDDERFARARPELERRFVQENVVARERVVVRELRAGYDRTERP